MLLELEVLVAVGLPLFEVQVQVTPEVFVAVQAASLVKIAEALAQLPLAGL